MNPELDQRLHAADRNRYGDDYQGDYLTMYRDFVNSAHGVTTQRGNANKFYLGVNTALLGSIGYFQLTDGVQIISFAVLGMAICWAWQGTILSYKTLNGAKFQVIQAMEQKLPLAPFTAEEYAYSNASTKHIIQSRWEAKAPLFFAALHGVLGVFNAFRIYWP